MNQDARRCGSPSERKGALIRDGKARWSKRRLRFRKPIHIRKRFGPRNRAPPGSSFVGSRVS
jgi:hypothetical protein